MSRGVGSSNRGNMRHGLISLLTVIVVLSLATAAVLAVATSHAMAALAEREAAMTADAYAAEVSAQTFLAELDELLHEQGTAQKTAKALDDKANKMLATACEADVFATYDIRDKTVTCSFTTKNARMLTIEVELGDASYIITSWRLSSAPQEEDTGDTLWTGTTSEN